MNEQSESEMEIKWSLNDLDPHFCSSYLVFAFNFFNRNRAQIHKKVSEWFELQIWIFPKKKLPHHEYKLLKRKKKDFNHKVKALYWKRYCIKFSWIANPSSKK